MRYLLLTLLILSTDVTAEVYKTINPDGSVSYSDVQSDNAKAITPPGLTPTPSVKLPKKAKTKPVDENKVLPYTTFKITSPSKNQTIRNNNGKVKVSIDIKPSLQTKFKHSISIFLDGREITSKLTTHSHVLKDIYRGRHSISAKLLDENGAILKVSNLVFVNVRRFSALNKKQLDQKQKPAETDTENDSDSDSNNTQPNDSQNPWPSLPDHSKPQNVWPSLPNTPPPANTP